MAFLSSIETLRVTVKRLRKEITDCELELKYNRHLKPLTVEKLRKRIEDAKIEECQLSEKLANLEIKQ